MLFITKASLNILLSSYGKTRWMSQLFENDEPFCTDMSKLKVPMSHSVIGLRVIGCETNL